MPVIVGCSVGTGWAVLVVVASGGPAAGTPVEVVDRRRVELVPGFRRFVYHAAADQALAEAEALVRQVRDDAMARAAQEVGELLGTLEAGGITVGEAVTVGAAPGPARPLADIVRSHTAVHTAEGDLYRSTLADAFTNGGIRVRTIPRRDLALRLADTVGADPAAIDATLRQIGRSLGPPWRKEQKEATLAAWWGLASVTAPG